MTADECFAMLFKVLVDQGLSTVIDTVGEAKTFYKNLVGESKERARSGRASSRPPATSLESRGRMLHCTWT